MATVLAKDVLVVTVNEEEKGSASTLALAAIPPLGAPAGEKRFWFQRGKSYNADAIATQVPTEHPGPTRPHFHLVGVNTKYPVFRSASLTIPRQRSNTTQSRHGEHPT